MRRRALNEFAPYLVLQKSAESSDGESHQSSVTEAGSETDAANPNPAEESASSRLPRKSARGSEAGRSASASQSSV